MAGKNSFFDKALKLIDNPYAGVAKDGTVADVAEYVDTGSYALNALLSGSIYKGLPQNHITGLAGEEATGKTFFTLGIIKSFLDKDAKNQVVLFDTESAIKSNMLNERGIDSSRILVIPVETVQQFKITALKLIKMYSEGDDKPNLLFALDSLGMLSTTKEMTDGEEGKEVKDMTKAQEIKGVFRTLTLKLSKCAIPMIVTNHVYAQFGQMFPTKDMGGGGGLKYAASNIIFLSKRKEKDADGDVVGNIIHCKGVKLRDTRENAKVDVLLTYDRGLDRYYGLTDIAVQAGIFKKLDRQLELPGGIKVFEKALKDKPEKFFTKELLDQIDEACKKLFLYGTAQADEVEDIEVAEDE